MRVIEISEIEVNGASPEKAGVGDSIPSLATTKSIAYKASFGVLIPFHSKIVARHGSLRLECWSVAERLASRLAAANRLEFSLSCQFPLELDCRTQSRRSLRSGRPSRSA